MVTLTSFCALKSFPSALTTAITLPVLPIFTRVEAKGIVFALKLKLAIKGIGLASAKMLMLSTPVMSVETVTGTTAPFSAISGALIFMSLEGEGAPPTTALMAASTSLLSKAALGHSASTIEGASNPALTAMPVALAAKVPFRKVLRCILIVAPFRIDSI